MMKRGYAELSSFWATLFGGDARAIHIVAR
jgi:hypothetical protein